MGKNKGLLTAVIAFLLVSGCANQDAAQLGSLIGRSLGRPIGTVATAIDETFQTAGDVVKENPRYQQQRQSQPAPQLAPASAPSDQSAHYYKAEVLIKTRGPARIESMNLQQTEDVSAFWR